ncbi:hypothetical protein [Streptomyces sp. NBC_01483]|uniref:hypothetical protein n=1 Tax=Streptomyces sp. NBC_01483 TaxID=2903883 RepID=UPI002E2F4CB8|nr:hypothetical protein [Streptomyces sp. NBC_01483]
MAEFSAPFDSSPITTELQWSRMARQWGMDGVHTEDPASTALKVAGNGTGVVTVAPGKAFVNGFFYLLDATKNLSVPANAGGTARVDLVVLRADQAANSVTAQYKTGGTTAPVLTQDETGVWEIPIAQCTVAGGSSVVTAANVLDKRYLTDRGVFPSIAGARRPSIKNQLLVEDNKLYIGDGADWKWLATAGIAESTYTPAWTAGSNTINWGSGSQNIGRYQLVGRRVDLTIQLTPTGNPVGYPYPLNVSLPPGLPATADNHSLFTWAFTSSNGEGSAVGVGMIFPSEGQSKISRLRYPATDGVSVSSSVSSINMNNNQPFNIRTGDVLTIDGSYWTV